MYLKSYCDYHSLLKEVHCLMVSTAKYAYLYLVLNLSYGLEGSSVAEPALQLRLWF